MSSKRILAVDDEPMNLKIIRATLSSSGYQLDLAENGEIAWQRLQDPKVEYDLVVLDRMMPILDGMALLKRMKQEARYRHIPVIMQTAAAAPEQVAEGLAAGAHYYLTKPYEPDALRVIVEAALESYAHIAALEKSAQDCTLIRPLMLHAEFRFQTPIQIKALVAQLTNLCPIPATTTLGLSELLFNAVEHGNLGLSYEEKTRLKWEDGWEQEVERRLALPENASKFASIRLDVGASEVVFTVQDTGAGFDWNAYLEFSPDRAFDPNGRGIAMARSLSFSNLEYQGNGNTVVARVARHDA
jgi:CheY-like chemotaxis protein